MPATLTPPPVAPAPAPSPPPPAVGSVSPPAAAPRPVPEPRENTVAGERGEVTIPPSAHDLEGFRRWTRSDDFPENARIDFLAGRIFVDLTMQRHQAHALPKTEIITVVNLRNRELGLGELASDVTRVFLPGSGASFEPDVVLISFEAIDEGRVTETAAKDGSDGVEFVGPPELVVEIVSPSSVGKDTVELPAGCFAGGVAEYWLVDCRDEEAEEVGFLIHTRGETGFTAVEPDTDGFAASPTLGKAYRLSRERSRLGRWAYQLEER